MNVPLIAALAVAAVAIVALVVQAQVARGAVREHARERQLLLNQLLNLAGKPWLPAPAAAEPEPEPDLGEPMLTVAPDQLPDY